MSVINPSLLTTSATTCPDLSLVINYDNLSSTEELEALVEGFKQNMKRKEILQNHKPAIKQLPSGKWYTRIDGKKYERVIKKDLEDLIVKSYLEENITSLNSIFKSFINYRKKVVSSRTWKKDIQYFETYIQNSDLGQKDLATITLDDGYTFVDHCLQVKPDLKCKYWNNIRGCLNQMFQYAIDRNLITRNPIEHLKPQKDLFTAPTITRDGDTVFTREEQTKVIKLAEEDSARKQISEPLGIVLLFNLGLRDGELCALKWKDIETNLRGDYIHVQREMVANINEDGRCNGCLTQERR